MCNNCCNKNCISKFGLALTIIAGAFSIITIVICGVEYEFTNMDWIDGEKWKPLSIIIFVSESFAVAVMVLGILEFCCCSNSRCFSILFAILQSIALIFCFVIAIICLCASDTGKSKDFVGCKTKYKGLFTYWENIDKLFEVIDISLCSPECPCDFTNTVTKAFSENTTTKPYFDAYTVDGFHESFQNCSETVQTKVKEFFEKTEKDNDNKLSKLNLKNLAKYWEYIENKFDCVGWCQTTYTHTSDFTGGAEKDGMLMKYLFSGINRGIVKHPGCLNKMIDWIQPRLLAIGLVEFFAACVMVLTLILGICLICKNPKNAATNKNEKEDNKNKNEKKYEAQKTDDFQEMSAERVEVERTDKKSKKKKK